MDERDDEWGIWMTAESQPARSGIDWAEVGERLRWMAVGFIAMGVIILLVTGLR